MGFGVMRDEKLKLRDLVTSHTLRFESLRGECTIRRCSLVINILILTKKKVPLPVVGVIYCHLKLFLPLLVFPNFVVRNKIIIPVCTLVWNAIDYGPSPLRVCEYVIFSVSPGNWPFSCSVRSSSGKIKPSMIVTWCSPHISSLRLGISSPRLKYYGLTSM